MRDRYRTEPAHRFFSLMSSMSEVEVRPGNTITFISLVDLAQVENIRSQTPEHVRKPTYTAFVAKALALALTEFPYAHRRIYRNRWVPFSGLRLQKFHRYDIGILAERNVPNIEVATFMDVLRDVDQLTLHEISDWLNELAHCDEATNEQWRAFHRLATRVPSWLATFLAHLPMHFPRLWDRYRGSSAVISAPTKYGVDCLIGTWPATLGVSFGYVKPRAIVREDAVIVRSTFNLTVNWDRRVMAGAQAARFFRRLVEILENAETEMRGSYESPGLPASRERTSTAVDRKS